MKSKIAALLIGLIISVGLFWLMNTMLMSNPQSVRKTDNLNMMEFVRLKPTPPLKPPPKPPEKKILKVVEKTQKATPAKPVQKQEPPKVEKVAPVKSQPVQKVIKAQMPTVETPNLVIPAPTMQTNAPVISKPAPAVTSVGTKRKANGNAESKGISSGLVALQRIVPKYPPRALERRLEGWVKVQFTVTKEGTVKDASVVAAEPEDVFDSAALKAISQGKFKPEIVDGVPVERRGMQTIQFKISN